MTKPLVMRDLRERIRSGFTLIEVMVALTVGAVLILVGHALLEIESVASRTAREAADRAAAAANADHVLREIVGRIEVGSSGTRIFSGNGASVRFASWCEVPDGWLEPCRVDLRLDTASSAMALVMEIESFGGIESRRVTLREGLHAGALRYLGTASDGGQWFESWGQGIAAPIALGIIADDDTLIVPIGARG